MLLRIDTNASAVFSNKLERMSTSLLPVAVRNTLNKAAFDVKTGTMPAKAKEEFAQRQANFFRANSRVEKAGGTNINSMQSVVGFVSLGGNNKAVDDLEQQEHGGEIGGRAFIPLAQARTGNSWLRNVKKANRISEVKTKVVDANDAKGASEKEQMVKSVLHAGKGGYVLGNRTNDGGNRILFLVRSVTRKEGKTVANLLPVFAVKKGRTVAPKATHFMQEASTQSGNKLETFYQLEAERQLAKMAR